jgi:hypothetical protein
MNSTRRIDLFYVDQKTSDWTNEWQYYRVSSVYGISIETCEVDFPSLKDKGVPTQHPWIIGLASAHDIKGKHLSTLGINQDRAVLMGMVVHE